MTGKYFIQKLQQNYVVESKKIAGKRILNSKVSGYCFPSVYDRLRVRPNAARFAKDPFNDVYVVFFQNDIASWGIFLFKFSTCKNGKIVTTFCRCVGSRAARKHWKQVISLVDDCKERIKKLSYGDSLDFYSRNNL